jgi:hypothetical protein
MKRSQRWVAGAIVFISLAAAATASQGVPDYFDNTRTITIKGQVGGFTSPGQANPFYLHVNVPTNKDAKERWMVAGRNRPGLLRLGWLFGEGGNLKSGDMVTVTAYPLKPAASIKEALEVVPPEVVEQMKPDRVAHGVEVSVAGGTARGWGER